MASLRLPFLGLLLLTIQGAGAAELPDKNCDKTNIDIKGGTYTLSDGGNKNSKLEYKCPEGKYPYPVLSRTCTSLGKWTTMKSAEGKTVEKAICKDIQCPRPVDFEHGSYYPRENLYNLGSSLEFECYEGYKLRGSLNRTCMANGKWSGDTAICDDGSSPCPHPGQPIGSIKFGNRYNIEDVVKYQCQRGLSMFGSSQRVCLERHEWSGTEPSCRQRYTFDTPDEVASSFIGSLSAAIEVADKNKESETKTQRKIKIEPGGNLNIYVILDASESVKKPNFDKAKDCVVSLIEKIATYDITPRYVIITYATEPQVLIDLEDEDSTKADVVIDKLMDFNYESHNEKSGTNTRGAIDKVYHMMSLHQQRNKDKFAAIRHVIILMTDGKANMGGDPKISMTRIRDFVNITLGREDYLDVYVFGLGDEVSDDEINGLASKKDREKHVFKVEDITDLGKTFNEMINEESAMNMCGMSKEYKELKKEEERQEMNPWLASISTTRDTGVEKCKGSILSPHYILTAAHCFTIEDRAHTITVETDVARNPQKFRVKSITSHPNYNINSKKPKFAEFYDYDIALVETNERITFNSRVRPICIPCTEGTTRALKKSHPQTTCQDHEAELLPLGLVGAMFVSEEKAEPKRYNVKAKTGDQEKAVCNKDALKAQSVRNLKKIFIYENVTDVSEVVTDRFLCTGGTEPEVDPYTCKGDSGGPLLISKKNRYIQVGVISWGVTNLCDKMERKAQTQTYSRDFYLNLFKVMPWLKEMLKDEGLQFLP